MFDSFRSKRDDVDAWLEGRSAEDAASKVSSDDMSMVQMARQIGRVEVIMPADSRDQPARKSSVADRYPTVSLPVRDDSNSFLSALNSTISPRVRKDPLVIPGSRKRLPARLKQAQQEKHLHPHLRFGIVLVLIIIALLLTALSLSPVGNSQVDVPFVGGFIQWAQDEQMQMDIAARHDQAPDQGTTTTTTTAPVGLMLPRSQYVAIAQAAAQKYGISPVYFVNQIQQESHFNPYAQSGAAVGIAQFEPMTAASMGINPYDPNAALDGAARYMSLLQGQFGGDYAKALAAYNGGSGTVQAAVRNCGTGWMSCISPQTQNYINIIMH